MIVTDFQPYLRLILPGKADTPIESIPKFYKNENVQGKLLRFEPGGIALVLIKGKKLRVKTDLSLRPGTVINLKVEKLAPVPTLKYMGIAHTDPQKINISVILSAIKENLWRLTAENIKYLNLSGKEKSMLNEFMRELTLKIFLKSAPELLKSIINKAGFNWEPKLVKALSQQAIPRDSLDRLIENDLKGILIRLLARGKKGNIHLKRLHMALKNIQLLNRQGLQQDGKIFLPIPIQFPGGFFTIGQLLLQLPTWEQNSTQSKRDNDHIYKATFLIDLSRLGPVRAEFVMRGKEIEGLFLITEKKAKVLLEDNMASFISILKDRGFSIKHIKCFLKDSDTINKSLVKENFQEENNSLCLVA